MADTQSNAHKPLIAKLGYLPDHAVYITDAPEWFTTYLRGEGVHIAHELPAEWAHVFAPTRDHLVRWLRFHPPAHIYKGIWVSWPKQRSTTDTDLTEQALRDIILPMGWVDTKVIAVDDTWSGLKFTKRKHLQ